MRHIETKTVNNAVHVYVNIDLACNKSISILASHLKGL